jgi:hypothetical protein
LENIQALNSIIVIKTDKVKIIPIGNRPLEEKT